MMPGFMDAHAHTMFQIPFGEARRTDQFYHALVSTQTAESYLMNGFTTVRDVGGNSFSLKLAIGPGYRSRSAYLSFGPSLLHISLWTGVLGPEF